jgi:hypothetical protein
MDICWTNNTGAAVCSLRIVVIPGLKDCNMTSGTSPVPDLRYIHPGILYSSYQHYTTGTVRDSTEIILTALNGSHCINDCQQMCFRIKSCPVVDKIPHSIRIEAIGAEDPCMPPPSASFKPSTGSSKTGSELEQSYPNPMTSDNSYKTVIPFSTLGEGIAIITVVNEAGGVVFTQEQEIAGKGRHAFYFSGEYLPAGTYYYRIESPRGFSIVEKTMLIVR